MRNKHFALLGALALLLTSCATQGSGEAVAPIPTVTVTETQFVTVSPSATAPSNTPSDLETESSDPASIEETEDISTGGEDEISVIKREDAGRLLVLSDFVRPDENWKQNRYSIASKTNINGIGTEVSSCADYDARVLEMRLANNFQKLEFSVGQDNLSGKTDQKLVVRVKGNNKELEVYRVPFNKYQTFSVDVSNVNALTIETFLDEEVDNCGGSALAVFYDIKML